jgi:predicted amino acid racemase
MVELGDLREGIMPDDLTDTVRDILRLPNIAFKGIGTNLACRSGVSPDGNKMAQLSELADSIEETLGLAVEIVSGGNSANLEWALNSAETGRINDLRLGEAILLGRETLHRQPIDGLHTDAITLCAEVIEAKIKPSKPSGRIAQTAFGTAPPVTDRGRVTQTIVAVGQQDIDPAGLQAPTGIDVMGASSDHLILESDPFELSVGAEVTFQLNYSALVRAMTSPFVTRVMSRCPADERVA